MKVNILHGVSQPAHFKRDVYADAIKKVGHTPVFNQEEARRHIVVTEHKHRDWVRLTGHTGAFSNAGDKLLYGAALPKGLHQPFTSLNVDDFENTPFIIKQRFGSGTTFAHPWSYMRFENKGDFMDYLNTNPSIHDQYRYFTSEGHKESRMGEYVFQQAFEDVAHANYHIMNDGSGPRLWMYGENAWRGLGKGLISTFGFFKDKPVEMDLPPGCFASLQAIEHDGKHYVFDMNVRTSGHWDVTKNYRCPEFYEIFFDNWLNNAGRKLPAFEPYLRDNNPAGVLIDTKIIGSDFALDGHDFLSVPTFACPADRL